MARRDVDYEIPNAAVGDSLQVITDRPDMHTLHEARFWLRVPCQAWTTNSNRLRRAVSAFNLARLNTGILKDGFELLDLFVGELAVVEPFILATRDLQFQLAVLRRDAVCKSSLHSPTLHACTRRLPQQFRRLPPARPVALADLDRTLSLECGPPLRRSPLGLPVCPGGILHLLPGLNCNAGGAPETPLTHWPSAFRCWGALVPGFVFGFMMSTPSFSCLLS
jgi:hypothetical protein